MRTLLTYIPHISYGVVKDIVSEHNSKLDRVRKVLAEKFLTYQRSSPEGYERRKQMILP